jgi:hypothetical protein
LTIALILEWADFEHEQTGRWPQAHHRIVLLANKNEKWSNINNYLLRGCRGLPGGDTLARLLARERGVRNLGDLPDLTIAQILQWADFEHEQTGRWPLRNGGTVLANKNEKWSSIHNCLIAGLRGLPGGDTLRRLLARQRGVRHKCDLPRLTEAHIAQWIRAHHEATGGWPHAQLGPIPAATGETWCGVDHALNDGSRGLPGGETLARFITRHFGVWTRATLPDLTIEQILAWADAHHQRTGHWPTLTLGPVTGAPGETWQAIDSALRQGKRGLEGGSSLARLLAQHRGVRNTADLPPLAISQILAWADAHHQRTGHWPSQYSGPVAQAPGESWRGIHAALLRGMRGLPGGDSLFQLFRRERRARSERAA